MAKLSYNQVLGEFATMNYESPIRIISKGVRVDIENEVIKTVHSYDIAVDKDELFKALEYDRNQYEKGFTDGRRSNTDAMRETVKAFAERIKNYYKHLKGHTASAMVEYHIDQLVKEFVGETS